jgi:hypothetical protein
LPASLSSSNDFEIGSNNRVAAVLRLVLIVPGSGLNLLLLLDYGLGEHRSIHSSSLKGLGPST